MGETGAKLLLTSISSEIIINRVQPLEREKEEGRRSCATGKFQISYQIILEEFE